MCSARKYPFRRYILGVLMHTSALDHHLESDETEVRSDLCSLGLPHLLNKTKDWALVHERELLVF